MTTRPAGPLLDVLVIGGGQAGLALCIAAAAIGVELLPAAAARRHRP
jgi:cation diffusion facilitator CzcD-associated flavoprotein CzcO